VSDKTDLQYNPSIPADRSYDREHHMWAQYDAASEQIRVGMDALGLNALGDLAYVTLKNIGAIVHRGESFGTLEAAKMTGDLIAPISGEIVARNENTVRDPSLVNQSPYIAAIPNLKQHQGGSGASSRPCSIKRNKSSQESKTM
jgi:glycine cleavage system H protein